MTPGFSPVAGNVLNAEKLSLAYGASDAVKSWKLEIMDSSGGTQKTFTGDGSNLPKTVSWDGKNDGGTLSPEGSYTAKLSVDYGTAYAPGYNHEQLFRAGHHAAFGQHRAVRAAVLPYRRLAYHHADGQRKLTAREDRQLEHGDLRPGEPPLQDLQGEVALQGRGMGRQGHQGGPGAVRGGLPGRRQGAGRVRERRGAESHGARRHPGGEDRDGVPDPELAHLLQGVHGRLPRRAARPCQPEHEAADATWQRS